MRLLVTLQLLAHASLTAASSLQACHQPAQWFSQLASDEGVVGRNAEGDEYRRWCRPAADGDRVCIAGPLGLGKETLVIPFELSYRRGDALLHRVEVGADVTAGSEALVVDMLSVDGFPGQSTVAAVMASRSNGIGIEQWSVWVYDEHGRPQLSNVQTANYGELSGWFRERRDSQCQLWISRWCEGTEKSLGPGLYVEGQWLSFNDSEPLARRRYRESFAEARHSTGESRPLQWFMPASVAQIQAPELGEATASVLNPCGKALQSNTSIASSQNNQP